jgi:hypothetical protein
MRTIAGNEGKSGMNLENWVRELEKLKHMTFSHFESLWVENEFRNQMKGSVWDICLVLFDFEDKGIIEKLENPVAGKRIMSNVMFP